MNDRWWTDVEKAQQALSIVGGDDVAQSVGTVALGFHAVLADELRPLANATLVDHQRVAEALAEVDLVPVTKAMAAAVSPVLGSASQAYAADLVSQLHEEARDGIRHELTVLTSKGVPWPQAIERVCGVAGVPVRAVNGYVQKMAAPQVNPRVLADEGDRTLLTWASRLGQREATSPLESITKAGAQQEWDPREHPRSDQTGEFVADDAAPEAESRRQRIARISRIARIQGRAQKEQEAEKQKRDKEKSLADLRAEVLQRPQLGRPQLGRAQRGRPLQGRQTAQRGAAAAETAKERPAARPRGQGMGYSVQYGAIDIDLSDPRIRIDQEGQIISASELIKTGEELRTERGTPQKPGMMRIEIDNPYVTHDINGVGELDKEYDYVVETIGFMPGTYQMRVQMRAVEPEGFGKADWEAEEHPRSDETGRFVDAESRRDRINRIARIARISGRAQERSEAAQEAPQDEQRAAAAGITRIQQGRPQRGRTQRGRHQQTRLVGTGRDHREAEESDYDSNILAAHDNAVLVDDYMITQLTGHQVLDDELENPYPLLPPDLTATDLKKLMKHGHNVAAGDVARVLSTQAINHIGNKINPVYGSDVYYDSPEDALEEARLALLGGEFNDSGVFVPSVMEGPAPNTFRPGYANQALPEKQKTPQHVVTGDRMALHKLMQGDTRWLTIRRAHAGIGADEMKAMGGGAVDARYVKPYLDSAVFEVVDTRPTPKRRA